MGICKQVGYTLADVLWTSMNVVCSQALWHVSPEDEIRCPLRHHNRRNIQISRRNERKYARVRNPEIKKKLKTHFLLFF
jgi:hypothetical protein